MSALTQGPKDTDPAQEQPNIVVATNLSHPPPSDGRLDYAKAALQSLTAIHKTTIGDAKLLDLHGAQWAAIQATATAGPGDTPIGVRFFVRFETTGTLMVICRVPAASTQAFDERFSQLALSVTPNG